MRTKRNRHRSRLGPSAATISRRTVWGLFFLWLVTTGLFVAAGLFLADVSLAPKTDPVGQEQQDEEPAVVVEIEPIETQPDPIEITPEVATTEPEKPDGPPDNTQPPTPPQNSGNTNSQITEPDNPPVPTQPPAEIDNVELKPIETIDPEELQPETELPPDPDPDPDPQPQPQPQPGADLADKINISANARTNYWGPTSPQIVSSDDVRRSCKQVEHIIHGCYLRSGRIERIYIINTSCSGLTESTAVHELLHSIYSHLNQNKRDDLNALILDYYAKNPSQLDSLLAPYDHLSGDSRINELHSFIGQSARDLPAGLSQHYDRYFADGRTAAIGYHEQYKLLLDGRRQQISSLSRQIKTFQTQLDEKRQQVDAMRDQINNDLAWFESQEELLGELKADLTNPEVNAHHNQLVDEYNQRVQDYRQRASSYNQTVEEHNRLVEETRQSVESHNRLVEEINRINRGDCQDLS